MLAAFRAGVSSVNAMARTVGARVEAIDVGVGRPTGNLRHEQAMDADRFDAAATTGAQTVATLAESGALDLLIIGEMGIGNTTAAAAVSAALFGGDVAGWVGRGTGVTSEAHINKIAVVGDAVARVGDAQSPLEILRQLGGAELVAMAGAVVEARRRSIPVVLDGYVTAAAVAPLALTRAGSLDHCLAGHVSAEPGHRRLLDRLGLSPLLDLGMRLGEASGALAAVPLIQMACALVLDVPTFDEWLAG
jgi:nicotinate-nucleotide--dimethylbenzimidazole phosphoribosyltransferase